MPRLYSDLHRNIQDCFNEAGVEILSPHYRAMRDGSMITIPPDYLPEDPYNPAFRVHHVSPVSAGKLETTDSERS